MSQATATPVIPTAEPLDRRARRRPELDPRFLPPILITLILVGGNASLGMLESPWKTALAILTAMLVELGLGRLVVGRWPHLASAYITGISVGILVRSPFYWPYALCSALSIASKYAIRYRGRHLFNPSNLGIVAMLFLAPAAVASLSIQWGNRLLLMLPIWLVGLLVLSRLRRLHITLTYILAFTFLAGARSLLIDQPFLAELAPVTGPMYQLFAMFMVTDPRTTVAGRRGQIGVVLLVALVECGFRLLQVVHAPYYALFLVGPTALIIQRSRRPSEAPGGESGARLPEAGAAA